MKSLQKSLQVLGFVAAALSAMACDVPPAEDEQKSTGESDSSSGANDESELETSESALVVERRWEKQRPFDCSYGNRKDDTDVYAPDYLGKRCRQPRAQLAAFETRVIQSPYYRCQGTYRDGFGQLQSCARLGDRLTCPFGCSGIKPLVRVVCEGDIICRRTDR